MHKSAWHSIAFTLFLLCSCGPSHPHLDGVDEPSWKNDKNGCKGERVQMIDSLLSQKEKLLGLSELDIVEVLGKPDKQELYKRNQKFYYYFIAPSPDCHLPTGVDSRQLVIRFNAVGLAKEIVIEE
jgi:hypothetical protein